MMVWFYLVLAGLFEMFGVTMINMFHQKRTFSILLLLLIGFGASFLFLALAMETLPMGTAYAVWTGIGASGGALMGMVFFQEPKDVKRIMCIALILASAVGLKLIG